MSHVSQQRAGRCVAQMTDLATNKGDSNWQNKKDKAKLGVVSVMADNVDAVKV